MYEGIPVIHDVEEVMETMIDSAGASFDEDPMLLEAMPSGSAADWFAT